MPEQVENIPVGVGDRDKSNNRDVSSYFIGSMCRHGLK
jgi:hypothetical protein